MRALFQLLALASLLVFSGCRTRPQPPPTPDTGFALTEAQAGFSDALAHYSQALISENTLGEFQNGLIHFRVAAALDRSSLPLNLKVVLDLLARKDYTGAVAVLEQAERHNPKSVEIQLLLGSARQGAGTIKGAIQAFEKARKMAPERHEAYVRLASLYVVRLTPRKALKVIEEGLVRVKDPNPLLDLCSTVGRIYLSGKDTSAAIRMFEPVFRYGSGHDDTCELLGQCYAALGRNREAETVFKALLKRKPDSSQYAMLLGEVYEQVKSVTPAIEAYRLAVKGTPPEPMATLRLANLEMELNPVAGLETLEKAGLQFPDDIRVHVFLALSYMRLDRHKDALVQFDWISRALEGDKGTARSVQPLFYFWYGQACDRAGRPTEAERYIGKYLVANPESSEALNYLAYMWAEQGRNLDQALAYVTKALRIEPDNGAYLDTLGWIHFKKGDAVAATTPLTRALKLEGESSTILDHLGDAWHARSEERKALALWRRALNAEPASRSIREKLIKAGVDAKTLPPVPAPNPNRPAGRFPI